MKRWRGLKSSIIALLLSMSLLYASPCERIVSISPATTDLVIGIGLADKIVGATRYCLLPNRESITDVGGYFDLNLEQIHRINPDLVIMQGGESLAIYQSLKNLGYSVLSLKLDRLEDVVESENIVRQYCQLPSELSEASAISQLATTIDQLKRNVQTDGSKRALILYGAAEESQIKVPEMAAGPSFHHDILSLFGVKNAYQGSLNAPMLSAEAIYQLNPEWIIILESDEAPSFAERYQLTTKKLAVDWGILNRIDAVKKGQVYSIRGFATQIPSPNALNALIEQFRKIINKTEEP